MNKDNKRAFDVLSGLLLTTGYYNSYSNITYLLFLKYIVSYSDKLNIADVSTYKIISEFTRKYNLARTGIQPLTINDIKTVTDALDSSLACGGVHLSDSLKSYSEIFEGRIEQKRLLEALDNFDFSNIEEFYEILLSRSSFDVRTTGEHVTNKSLRQLASQLLNVNKNDVYLDCFCGYSSSMLNISEYKKYIGYDTDSNAALISKINMLLLNKENCEIHCENFLKSDAVNIADKVFSDGPIAGSYVDKIKISKSFDIETRDTSLLQYIKSLDALKEGGTAVLTVPGKALFSIQSSYKKFRDQLLHNGLKAVVSLPAMWAGTACPTNLLVIEKGYSGNIEFVDATKMAYVEKRINYLSDETINKIVKVICNKESELNFCESVSIQDVAEQESWVPAKYLTVEIVNSYREVKEIDSELSDLYKQIKENL